jgi:exopolysaccharide biosynthesis protein
VEWEGVPFYGITLEADGLHMYVGADNEEVLSHQPLQTWSFYDGCVLVREDVNMVDHEWQFANERNIRTIIGRLADDTVFVLTVTAKTNEGLTMVQSADWVIEHLHPLWAFNLDGGPSSALLVRPNRTGALKTVYGNIVKTVDIMGFCELPGD